jgi:hypothetical protein
MNRLLVQTISAAEMAEFVKKHHYSSVMPRITKERFGGFRDGRLVAAISFGWGSRPLHTIRKIFPSLGTVDYLEIGKLCLVDEEPKNSESQFMATAIYRLRKQHPTLKLIFTWADGLWGKPGYIYQASNFLYGGYIWTDVCQTHEGKRLHPLQLQAELRKHGSAGRQRTKRPAPEQLRAFGWMHIFGKQFRYVRFLCDEQEQRRLISESPFLWSRSYPKHADLAWKARVGGSRVPCSQPHLGGGQGVGPVSNVRVTRYF